MTDTILLVGSIIQYSGTPWVAYSSRLARQSLVDDDGDRISTMRSGHSLHIGMRQDVFAFSGDEHQVRLYNVGIREQNVEWSAVHPAQIVLLDEGVHLKSQLHNHGLVISVR